MRHYDYMGGSHDELNPCKAGRRTLWKGSKSESSNEANTTTTNTDKRQVVDNQSVGVSSDSSTVTVYATDDGAVKQAIDLTGGVAQGALDGYRALLAATVALASKQGDMQATNSSLANSLATPIIKNKDDGDNLKYGLIAVAGLAAFSFLGKK